MYGEHSNGGMKEVDSRNVDFLEDEFPSLGEVKKDTQFYELQHDLTLSEGENLYTNRVTEGDRVTESDLFFPFDRDSGSVPTVPIGRDLSAQDTQPENEEIPQSPVDGHEDRPHSHEPIPQEVRGSDPSPSQGSVPRTKRMSDPEPESTMQPSPRLLRKSEGGRVPRRFFFKSKKTFSSVCHCR